MKDLTTAIPETASFIVRLKFNETEASETKCIT